jgi:hypothetical protein
MDSSTSVIGTQSQTHRRLFDCRNRTPVASLAFSKHSRAQSLPAIRLVGSNTMHMATIHIRPPTTSRMNARALAVRQYYSVALSHSMRVVGQSGWRFGVARGCNVFRRPPQSPIRFMKERSLPERVPRCHPRAHPSPSWSPSLWWRSKLSAVAPCCW